MTWFERYQFFNNLEKINLPTCVPLVSRKNIKWKQNEVLVIETLILPWIFVCYFNRKWREDKTSAYKYVSWKCVFPSQQSTHLISIWNVHQITQWTHLISWGRRVISIYGKFVSTEHFHNVLNDCSYTDIGGISYLYMWYYDIYVHIGNILNLKTTRCNKVWLVFQV